MPRARSFDMPSYHLRKTISACRSTLVSSAVPTLETIGIDDPPEEG